MLFSQLPPLLDWTLSLAVGCVLLVFSLVYVFQERLIYMPDFPPGSREHVWTPDRFGMPFESVDIVNPKDGVKTVGYYIKPQTTQANNNKLIAVHFCHANAGNLGHRLPIIRRLRDVCTAKGISISVFMPSYRGYGKSEGRPSEDLIREDVQLGLDWFTDKIKSDDCKLIAYGQSIGGAVAIDLVSRNQDKFSGLIVENTFTSLPDLVPDIVPLLWPFTFMLRQRWPSIDRLYRLKGYDLKVLLLSGLKDTLIPPKHSQALHSALRKLDVEVELATFTDGSHNDTVLQKGYFDAIARLLSDL